MVNKKSKVEEVYSDGRFKHEDRYEIMKVQMVIMTHIFKYVKFCKGEGTTFPANSFEKKNVKILQYGKSHKKADLSKHVRYEYNIMRLVRYEKYKITNR